MDELVGNTDGFADSGCVIFLNLALVFAQNNALPQCQFGYRPAISEPYIRRCAVPISTNPSSGHRCPKLHNQTGPGSSTSGTPHYQCVVVH
jgi:hypothetical protein